MLILPCLLVLSSTLWAILTGLFYSAVLSAVFRTESGRKYLYNVTKAYNDIFTFDKISCEK